METYYLLPKELIKINEYVCSPVELVAMERLTAFLDGLRVMGHGEIEGHHELVIHIRMIVAQYQNQVNRENDK